MAERLAPSGELKRQSCHSEASETDVPIYALRGTQDTRSAAPCAAIRVCAGQQGPAEVLSCNVAVDCRQIWEDVT